MDKPDEGDADRGSGRSKRKPDDQD